MAVVKSSLLNLRVASYLIFLFYLSVFSANFILLLVEKPWNDNSDKQWVRWVDISISGISILASLLLLIAIRKRKERLLAVFITWAILCIVLSIVVVGFGFREYKQNEIILKCVGIAITAYLVDVLLLFYYSLKCSDTKKTTRSASNVQPVQTPSIHVPTTCPAHYTNGEQNGGCNNDVKLPPSTSKIDISNYKLWYEETKM